MADNPKIRRVKLPGADTVYDIYDAAAMHDVKYADKKIQKSLDGTTYTDVVTAAQLKTDMGLGAAIKFKGTKPNKEAIFAITDPELGDLWIALDTNKEYICVDTSKAGTAGAWEELGSTIDTSGFLKKGVTYGGAAVSAGGHSHTVTGSVTVPTVTPTDKHLTISRTTDVALDTTAKSAVLTGVKVQTTDNVLGEATTFNTTVTPSSTKISATASGTAVGADGVVSAITGFGSHSTDTALGTGATFSTSVTPTTAYIQATATGTAVSTSSAAFVKSYPGVTSKLATTSLKGVAGTTSVATVTSAGSTTAGAAAVWSATVSDGLLEFSWTANTPTAVTLPAFGSATVATANASATTVATGALASDATGASVLTGLGTASTSNALISAAISTQPTVALATAAASGTGIVNVATGISAATTTVSAADTVTAITALGTASKATVLTGVKVTAQPTIAITSGATGDVTVLTGISSATTNAVTSGVGSDIVAAATAVAGNGTANALTAVTVSAQPAFGLSDTATSGGIAFVGAVSVGTSSASLANGAAATSGAHTHDLFVSAS